MSSTQSLVDYDAADTGAAVSITGGLVVDSITLGSGAALGGILSSVVSVDFASVPGNDSVTTTATLTGAAVGDAVIVTPSSQWSGAYLDLAVSGQVTAADTVTLTAANSAATAVNPAAVNFRLTAINFA
jgi:hypothetical protein